MSLENTVNIVFGGAGLLGREFSRGILSSGGRLIVAEYNLDICREFEEALGNEFSHENFIFVEANITDEKSIKRLINKCLDKFGKLDSVVNTAYPRNKNYGNHFFDVTLEDFNENIGLNLGGYFLTTKVFANFFKKQGYGNIVNISSVYGVIAPRFEIYEDTEMTMPVEYAVIKSGLIHLTKYVAKYLKGTGVRVNCLSPGGILNGQYELFVKEYGKNCLNKGMLDRTDVVGGLLFLLGSESKYVNGQNLIIDDGFVL